MNDRDIAAMSKWWSKGATAGRIFKTRTERLEVFRFRLQQRISEYVFDDGFHGDVEVLADYTARELVAVLRVSVAGQSAERIVVSYPADWWEAFKQRWLPTLPVKLITKTYDIKRLFPDYPLPSQLGNPVFHVQELVSEKTV